MYASGLILVIVPLHGFCLVVQQLRLSRFDASDSYVLRLEKPGSPSIEP